MPFDFKLPDVGEGISEVELRKWLVREGERVSEHQLLLEVESDKAVVELPSPRAGTIGRIHHGEGEIVRVGETLLTIATDEELPAGRPRSVGVVGVLPEAEDEDRAMTETRGEEVLATPLVRKLARERGIDLKGIRGSGPRGSITPEDLERTAPAQLPSGADYGP